MMRLYRILLHLYPASFREEYGEEMCCLLARRRQKATGARAVLLLWAACWEILPNALAVQGALLRQDLRFLARSLRQSPGFALTAIPVIALGIGATTAAFSLTDFVLRRPLPFPQPERLVKVWESLPGYPYLEPSPGNYRDWKRQNRSFTTLGALRSTSRNLVGPAGPERLEGMEVTADLFPLLGVRPALGRYFTADDDRADAADAADPAGTVLLSDGLWRRDFGADPAVLGRRVLLDGAPHVIVGVMPRGFSFPRREATFWVPIRFAEEDYVDRTNYCLNVVGRLRPGVSLARAGAEMRVIAAQLERQYPKDNRQTGAVLQKLRDTTSEKGRLLLFALCGAALCVLLITCANLANLLLARALARRAELEVRAALGAGRERLERLRGMLVIAEVATAVVLLVSAGLLLRALARVQATDPGFRASGVLTLRTALPIPKYEKTARRADYYAQVLSQVRALPGVKGAGFTSFLPMVMRGGIWPVSFGGEFLDRSADHSACLRFITPGFLPALGVPLYQGRDVSDADTPDRTFVAVVSASFVRRFWPKGNPLGRRFTFAFHERTVVGVVGDVRFRGLERTSEPQVYLPSQQVEDGALIFFAPKDLVIRTAVEPASLLPAVRRINSIGASLSPSGTRSILIVNPGGRMTRSRLAVRAGSSSRKRPSASVMAGRLNIGTEPSANWGTTWMRAWGTPWPPAVTRPSTARFRSRTRTGSGSVG